MRRYLGFLSVMLLLSTACCTSAQKGNEERTVLKIDSTKASAKKLYLHKNKKLEITEINGALTYQLVDDDKTNVVRFSYEKDMDKAAYDGGYREEVVFEYPINTNELNYANSQLTNTRMLFGRYCFCRGYTGLYKVSEGKLHLTTSKKETHFELQFKVADVPQVITEIKY